VSTAKH